MDLHQQRRFYAEEIKTIANLRTASLVEALAHVPREKFLPPGPWLIRSEIDYGGGPRQTSDADLRHVYHNIAIAIDPDRQLFNGAPSLVCTCLDRLALAAGTRVLHVGSGTGYYSALIARAVGQSGSVVAFEINESLADTARRNLQESAWIEVRHGNGTDVPREAFDAIFVNAGVTHPHERWLDGLKPGGRLLIPLTFTMPAMGPIGKGVMTLVTRDAEAWTARVVTLTAIYSALEVRSDALNDRIREAFMKGRMPEFTRLRRDPHEPSAACWLHGETFCFSK